MRIVSLSKVKKRRIPGGYESVICKQIAHRKEGER